MMILMSFTSSVAEAVDYSDASGRNPNRETTFCKVSVGQNSEVEIILSQLNNETRYRMRLEVVNSFIRIHSELRTKRKCCNLYALRNPLLKANWNS